MKKITLVILALLLLGACQTTDSEYDTLLLENKQLLAQMDQLQYDYGLLKTDLAACVKIDDANQLKEENRVKYAAGLLLDADLLADLNTKITDLSIIGSTDILGAYFTENDFDFVYLFFGNGKLIILSAPYYYDVYGGGIITEYTYTFDPKSSILNSTYISNSRERGGQIVQFMNDKSLKLIDENNRVYFRILNRFTPVS